MKLRYQYRLFFYFAIVLVIVVAGFSIFIMQREKAHNLKAMQSELVSYNTMVYHAIERNVPYDSISFQENVRLTIIDTAGNVIFDNSGKQSVYNANHITRPEVVKAKQEGTGLSLRRSRTLREEYLYYAQRYPNIYIRTALTYKTEVLPQINEDRKYLIGIVFLFICLVMMLVYITRKLTKPIVTFNAFIDAVKSPQKDFSNIKFGKDEFGDVGRKIVSTFEQLEQTKNYKQQMTQNIAHELKTPVTGIKAYLETIQHDDKMPREQMLYFIDKAYSQTIRLSSLIGNVSTLNKIEEATDKFNLEEVNFASCLKDINDEIGYKIASNKIVLNTYVNPDYSIKGNYFLIYYLLKNLIDNSIEHCGPNITIDLSCSKTEETDGKTVYSFVYCDNGKGVPPENLPRIFERFYRFEKGRTRKNGGSGLGLAIVKNAILFHKGNITVENRPEGGLMFKFTLQNLQNEYEKQKESLNSNNNQKEP